MGKDEVLPATTKGKVRRTCIDLRRTLSGIKCMLKSGSSWRTLPAEFENWNSVYRYFCRLQQKGIFKEIFEKLSKGADITEVSIDSAFVKVHKHVTGAKKGYATNSNEQRRRQYQGLCGGWWRGSSGKTCAQCRKRQWHNECALPFGRAFTWR